MLRRLSRVRMSILDGRFRLDGSGGLILRADTVSAAPLATTFSLPAAAPVACVASAGSSTAKSGDAAAAKSEGAVTSGKPGKPSGRAAKAGAATAPQAAAGASVPSTAAVAPAAATSEPKKVSVVTAGLPPPRSSCIRSGESGMHRFRDVDCTPMDASVTIA